MRTSILVGLGLLWAAPAAGQRLVVVDPGHGGHDPGAVGCGLEEEDAVVDIGNRLKPLLEGAGLRVAMTRSDDRFIELRARAAFANDRGATIFVSIHANANAGAPATGTETWIASNASNASNQLATRLQREMVAAWGLRDRGVKRGNFTVLTATSMPAALVETGFINNCNVDSALLANGGRRQGMAEALARGVTQHLGVEPPPVEPRQGVLRGVVFEDRGAGLDDPSVRVGGARVRVAETGAEVASAADTGAWRFELPPGAYTVRASREGFRAAERQCEVAAGGETWCSVGLQRADPPPQPDPDAGAPAEDAGVIVADDAGTFPAEDGTVPAEDAAPFEPDPDAALGPDASGISVIDTPRPRRPSVEPDGGLTRGSGGDGGCTVGGRGPAPWVLLLALLVPLALRRRGAAAAALLIFAAPARGHVPEVGPEGEQVVPGVVHAHLQLVNEQAVARGAFAAARLSPDGRYLALASAGFDQLFVAEARPDSPPRLLAEGARVGLVTQWQMGTGGPGAAAVAYLSPEQRAHAVPMLARGLDGAERVPEPPASSLRVRVRDDVVELFEGGGWYPISPPGDVYFAPQIAPDDRHVVFWGLASGLHLHRVEDARHLALGAGGHPSFDPTGRWLVFERTTDEGGVLTGGDLFICDLGGTGYPVSALTQTPDRIELAPSLAAGRLVFIAGEAVMMVDLVFAE